MNKAHGHDEISIRMLKLCESAITEPLYLIFKNCLSSNTFLDVWKKANVIPVHKKGDKQVLKNYRPVSLYRFVVKYLKNYYLMRFTLSLKTINYSIRVSQDSRKMIPV